MRDEERNTLVRSTPPPDRRHLHQSRLEALVGQLRSCRAAMTVDITPDRYFIETASFAKKTVSRSGEDLLRLVMCVATDELPAPQKQVYAPSSPAPATCLSLSSTEALAKNFNKDRGAVVDRIEMFTRTYGWVRERAR
jgi:hypothetical protein